MYHRYTKEQYKFIANNVEGITNKELTKKFNNKFGLNLTISQIKGFKKNNRLSSGLDGRFKKGQSPWNKGEKGFLNFKNSVFKKGHIPWNCKKIGSEKIRSDGYIEVKVADPSEWRFKHQVIWEKYNGPLPKNHVIIFADGNKRNFDINNLILITKQQLLILNKNGLIQKDAELTKTAVIIAGIYQKITERKNKNKKGKEY